MKLRHYLALGLGGIVVLLGLWVILAYGTLPRLWSRHEHKKIGARDQIIAYTSQDLPADPMNLRLEGSAQQVRCAFRRAGWVEAKPLSLRSGVGIVASIVTRRPDPEAPVSPLFFQDRLQDLAFERDEGTSAKRRHHVRLWQTAPGTWFGAASFDRGVGLTLYTLQVTHRIGHDVDGERDGVGSALQEAGARPAGSQLSRLVPGRHYRNGGGDSYRTDGKIKIYDLGGVRC